MSVLSWRLPGAALLAIAMLAGCHKDKPDTPVRQGQALASVNGEEITVLQLNEEMQRAGVPPAQQQAVGKQLLQALIDRALLEEQAARERIDRDPKVMQAIGRARSLIIAQAYMQQRVGDSGRPSQAEIQDYFDRHPQFFSQRRQFALDQLVMPASAVTAELRAVADRARSLDEVAVFLEARKIDHGRAQVTRSTADLKPEITDRLLSMPKGQLFFVQEGSRAMLMSIAEVRDAPVTLAIAAPEIAQFLANRKHRELAQAEIGRLRASAKIAYLNQDLAPDAGAPLSAPAALAAGGAAGGVGAVGAAGGQRPRPAGPAADSATAGARPPAGAAAITGAPTAGAGVVTGAAGEGGTDKAALDRGVAGLE